MPFSALGLAAPGMEIFTDTPREFSLDKFVFRMIQLRQGKQFLLPKFHIDRTMGSGEIA
jgi:hypothetical protein